MLAICVSALAISRGATRVGASSLRTSAIRMVRTLHVSAALRPDAARAPHSTSAAGAADPAAVGDKIPSIALDFEFPPSKVNMAERLAGKKTIVVPGYLAAQSALKAKGIDEVLVYCVNDGAVMGAWSKDQGVDGSMITFLADTRCEFTKAMNLVLDHPGPMSVLGTPRCKRFALYAVDGVIKVLNVSEGPDDPAGDTDPSASCVEAMLKLI
ncbi:hypothetical protein T492DRAFT_845085 [Pavlovales sp. CCMP2436]|nr:hypothetical protein T492DRAFT_845085 [Pavlovales sp. CCMP2436]